MSILSGKCLCNKVSYSCNAEPTSIFNCHCKDCRKATGSVFRMNLFFSKIMLKFMVNSLVLSIFLIMGVL